MSSNSEVAVTHSQAACALYGQDIIPENELLNEAKIDAMHELELCYINNTPSEPFLMSAGRIKYFPFRYNKYRRSIKSSCASTITIGKDVTEVNNQVIRYDDPHIADRFLASLTLSVQTLIRVTVARVGKNKADTNERWTVEYITQVGRDILGDDNKLYAEATALIPGANKSGTVKSRYSENSSRGDGSLSGHRRHQFKRRSQNMTKVNKHPGNEKVYERSELSSEQVFRITS
ncbi:hypothetical protein G6F37_003239 [Rhizopus arrhizus]|nr:hypothetical protein G6F38_007067 [Rhizopus arrhizus]KAG1161259.1 hypothetical protein G6F37_003239 [Rhizopus arrhizus]